MNCRTEQALNTLGLSVNDRIQIYEEKYKSCMDLASPLSTWIPRMKEKGPPSPLNEGYTPPAFKSRLSDYFSSFSPSKQRRRKSLIPTDITPKASISTLLKKASKSFSTHTRNTPELTIHTSNHRFTFNRFSSISEEKRSIRKQSIILLPPSPPSENTFEPCCKEITPPISPTEKKKRTSLLVTPSLSTIPKFLRRQSMHV